MGYHFAVHFLEAGFNVGIFDKNEHVMIELAHLGAIPHSSPRSLAENYHYIITMLPDDRIVKEVVQGKEGILYGFKPGSMLIEMSSSNPSATLELAGVLQQQGIRLIDAPVSGGVARARSGTLTIMVGGEHADYQEALPILQIIGENIFHVGGISSGHAMKALNNLISATTIAITAECLAIAVKNGIDPKTFIEIINTSTGRSHTSEVKFPEHILTRKFDGNFALGLMVKDMGNAIRLADDWKIPAPVASAAYQIWKQALMNGDPNADHTTFIKEIERNLQTEIHVF